MYRPIVQNVQYIKNVGTEHSSQVVFINIRTISEEQ